MVGINIIDIALKILNHGGLMKEINKTNIVLICNNLNPSSPMEFRPISLRNIVYKQISKLMMNRFKCVMSHLISRSQSSFLAGRSICDIIIVVYEVSPPMLVKTTESIDFVGVKVDMSKVYDRVEWLFIKRILSMCVFDFLQLVY